MSVYIYIYIFGTPQALTKQYKTVLFITAHPHAGSDEDLSDSDMEIDADKFKAQQAESRALTERKKAGLPELEVDQLPSTIANKMMTLFKKRVRTSQTALYTDKLLFLHLCK